MGNMPWKITVHFNGIFVRYNSPSSFPCPFFSSLSITSEASGFPADNCDDQRQEDQQGQHRLLDDTTTISVRAKRKRQNEEDLSFTQDTTSSPQDTASSTSQSSSTCKSLILSNSSAPIYPPPQSSLPSLPTRREIPPYICIHLNRHPLPRSSPTSVHTLTRDANTRQHQRQCPSRFRSHAHGRWHSPQHAYTRGQTTSQSTFFQ